jgi:cell division protease FtsH
MTFEKAPTATDDMTRPMTTAELLELWRWQGARVEWDDVIGHDAAKRELRVVAEQIRRQSTAELLGLTVVKGILMTGPAGVGKTLLAKALATAVDRPAHVIPAGEVTARQIREIYQALAGQPSVVIWDEADVVLRNRWGRGAPDDGRLVAAFCTALDGVEAISGPITLALSAEAPYQMDPAAIRAGRLATKIELANPDLAERRHLWRNDVGQVPLAGEIDIDRASERSVGMTGADIAATVMVALGLSMVDGVDALTASLLDETLSRRHHVSERPRRDIDVRRTAVHEAGHAIYAAICMGLDSVASVSVVPSAVQNGRTQLSDEWHQESDLDRSGLRKVAGLAYAGFVAEELVYGRAGVGAGASHDISKATDILRRLATNLGADETIGVLDLDQIEHGVNSDRGPGSMRQAVWDVVRLDAARILDETRRTLSPHQASIETFADALLSAADQTLSGGDLVHVLAPLIRDREVMGQAQELAGAENEPSTAALGGR